VSCVELLLEELRDLIAHARHEPVIDPNAVPSAWAASISEEARS
jgi:hypothetical protein